MEFTQNKIDKINEHNRNTANQISDDLGLSVKYLFLKDYPTATDERAFTWFFYFDEVEKKTTFTEHFGMKQKDYVMYHIEDRYKKRNDDFSKMVIQHFEIYRMRTKLNAELQTNIVEIKKTKI